MSNLNWPIFLVTEATPKLHKQEPLKEPNREVQVWSQDFMHHELSDSRMFRGLNVINDYGRERVSIETGF